jgi:hypothetical protein
MPPSGPGMPTFDLSGFLVNPRHNGAYLKREAYAVVFLHRQNPRSEWEVGDLLVASRHWYNSPKRPSSRTRRSPRKFSHWQVPGDQRVQPVLLNHRDLMRIDPPPVVDQRALPLETQRYAAISGLAASRPTPFSSDSQTGHGRQRHEQGDSAMVFESPTTREFEV